MKTLALAEAQTHLLAVMKAVEQGNEVAISNGNEPIAVIIPYERWKKLKVRQLGTLRGKGTIAFAADFAMSDEELGNP